ncbi:uncharacterized protein LOC133785661 [Humulus lupulus]|uniref:uncharacterized protein LOC133785661 n=1 Tax=Humulus lupulus TaxID=3486 RepID=UPI002B41488A|nr:uncharacterized protein LOC133785661 [Humulus lupulus]
MFRQQSDQSRHDATRSYMNTKMKKGVSVRTHVLHMIGLLHEPKTHGATIDERTQASIILESLTPSFQQFTTNYVMNKLQFNTTQLLNELTIFEYLNKDKSKEVEANNVEERPTSSSDKKRKWNDKDKIIKPKKGKKAPKANENVTSPIC